MPKVNVDFWDAIGPNGAWFDLLPVLTYAGTLNVPGRMRDRGAEYTDYLVEVEVRQAQSWGMAARIRKENLPERANLQTGALHPLDLALNEGLAEEVHFLYDRGLRVLLTQRNRIFRAGAVSNFVAELGNVIFGIQPKLREDAWRRFRRMQTIGSLELKLQTPEHHPDLSATIPSMGRFLDDASETVEAMSVELKFSMERVRRRSLAIEVIRGIVGRFRNQDNVAKMAVTGRAGDGERSEIIDFIRDRLVYTGEVLYDGRQLSREQCHQLLTQALEEHRAYLRTLL